MDRILFQRRCHNWSVVYVCVWERERVYSLQNDTFESFFFRETPRFTFYLGFNLHTKRIYYQACVSCSLQRPNDRRISFYFVIVKSILIFHMTMTTVVFVDRLPLSCIVRSTRFPTVAMKKNSYCVLFRNLRGLLDYLQSDLCVYVCLSGSVLLLRVNQY